MASTERVGVPAAWGSWARPMAANLARAGFEVTVWNRTRAKAERFAAEHDGATRGRHARPRPPPAPARSSRWCPTRPQVEEVLFGADGAADALPEGALVIDMSTIAPTASRRDRRAAGERGVGFVEAPGPGSRPRPRTARSRSWSAAEQADFERALPLLRGDGRADRARGPRRPRPDGQADQQHDRRGQRRGAGRGRSHGQGGRPRPRRVPGGGRRERRRSAHARPQGPAHVRRALRAAAVQARAHAQGRAPLPRRGRGAGHRAAARRARRAALRASRRERPRRAGLRGGDRGACHEIRAEIAIRSNASGGPRHPVSGGYSRRRALFGGFPLLCQSLSRNGP